jgi:NADH:ubiquinone oxidoreductase subunit 6 (subunit J)
MLLPIDLLVAGGFYTFAALAIVGALGAVMGRRIFHSALFLTAMLGSVAATYVALGADFLAVVQILVYVGAIMVLIIFGIMLTPQNVELPEVVGGGKGAAAGAVAVVVLLASAGALLSSAWPWSNPNPIDVPTAQTIGIALLTTRGLAFEVASVLLLLAMIGAIVIARED